MPENESTVDAGTSIQDAGTELTGTMVFLPQCESVDDPVVLAEVKDIVEAQGFKIKRVAQGDCTNVYPSPVPGCDEIALQVRVRDGIMVELEKDGVMVLGGAQSLVEAFVSSDCPPIRAEAHVVGISLQPGPGYSQTVINADAPEGAVMPDTATFYMYEGGAGLETTGHTASISLNQGDQMTLRTESPNQVVQDGRLSASHGMACSVEDGVQHTGVAVDPTLAFTALMVGVVNMKHRRKGPKATSKKD